VTKILVIISYLISDQFFFFKLVINLIVRFLITKNQYLVINIKKLINSNQILVTKNISY